MQFLQISIFGHGDGIKAPLNPPLRGTLGMAIEFCICFTNVFCPFLELLQRFGFEDILVFQVETELSPGVAQCFFTQFDL